MNRLCIRWCWISNSRQKRWGLLYIDSNICRASPSLSLSPLLVWSLLAVDGLVILCYWFACSYARSKWECLHRSMCFLSSICRRVQLHLQGYVFRLRCIAFARLQSSLVRIAETAVGEYLCCQRICHLEWGILKLFLLHLCAWYRSSVAVSPRTRNLSGAILHTDIYALIDSKPRRLAYYIFCSGIYLLSLRRCRTILPLHEMHICFPWLQQHDM